MLTNPWTVVIQIPPEAVCPTCDELLSHGDPLIALDVAYCYQCYHELHPSRALEVHRDLRYGSKDYVTKTDKGVMFALPKRGD